MYVHKKDNKIDGFARRSIPVESDSGEPCEGWEKLKDDDKAELETYLES